MITTTSSPRTAAGAAPPDAIAGPDADGIAAATVRSTDADSPDRAARTDDSAAPAEQAPDPFAIVVRGRHTGVPRRFRAAVPEKLARLARLAHDVVRVDVELSREHNPRQADSCDHVELTLIGRGPVVRAAAAAPEACAALDAAVDKAAEQLRRDADRRHCRGTRTAEHARVESSVQPGIPLPT